jgi:ABC-type cobalamin/Fe3+-siderophores transport system ATPase subunit
MTPILELTAVGFRYAERSVFEHMSFVLQEGSCTALIGPNGVGKTTLLRVAAGTLIATSGRVLLQGQSPAAMSLKQRSRLVALVPQQLDVPFDFTVEQIVEQGRSPYLGLLRGMMPEDRRAVDRALNLADVSDLRFRIFNELSGGERQRVKIALGLAQEPRLLLLDEPTQNLDIGRQVALIDLLHYLRDEGITILASIHDIHLIHHNFSFVHLMGPDHSLISGLPKNVLTSEHIASAFNCDLGRHPSLVETTAVHSGQGYQ